MTFSLIIYERIDVYFIVNMILNGLICSTNTKKHTYNVDVIHKPFHHSLWCASYTYRLAHQRSWVHFKVFSRHTKSWQILLTRLHVSHLPRLERLKFSESRTVVYAIAQAAGSYNAVVEHKCTIIQMNRFVCRIASQSPILMRGANWRSIRNFPKKADTRLRPRYQSVH